MIPSLNIEEKEEDLFVLLQTCARWTVILWSNISKLCMVIGISYASYILWRKKFKEKVSLDYSRLWKWLNTNINLLLDTLTSSDTLNTPDFTKLSSRYTEKDHRTIVSIMRRLINNYRFIHQLTMVLTESQNNNTQIKVHLKRITGSNVSWNSGKGAKKA